MAINIPEMLAPIRTSVTLASALEENASFPVLAASEERRRSGKSHKPKKIIQFDDFKNHIFENVKSKQFASLGD